MNIKGIPIDDTFAEAFGMRATRIIVTADSLRWARIAGENATGFATSVIGCKVEAGIECDLGTEETPDGRPGIAILFFAVSREALGKALLDRVGQSILTCPGTACYSGLAEGEKLRLGRSLRYFGDGYEKAKRIGDRRFWRIPVMDGEFVCDDSVGQKKAVGGGNFLILARSHPEALAAAEKAIDAMRTVRGAIMPFPGGVVRSGSKVGSRYKGLIASTNEAFSPTLKGVIEGAVDAEVGSVLEIVIDGLTEESVGQAMASGIRAACAGGTESGILRITAGNYGGKLGPFHFHLRKLLA